VGVFDGLEGASNTSDSVLVAGRFAFNFLKEEDNPAYYTSSTYYGGLGNILTVGAASQQIDIEPVFSSGNHYRGADQKDDRGYGEAGPDRIAHAIVQRKPGGDDFECEKRGGTQSRRGHAADRPASCPGGSEAQRVILEGFVAGEGVVFPPDREYQVRCRHQRRPQSGRCHWPARGFGALNRLSPRGDVFCKLTLP